MQTQFTDITTLITLSVGNATIYVVMSLDLIPIAAEEKKRKSESCVRQAKLKYERVENEFCCINTLNELRLLVNDLFVDSYYQMPSLSTI